MSAPGPVISPLERERFGVAAARWDAASEEGLADALAFCRDHGVDLLIARCDTRETAAVHALERAGGLLMDTLVHLACQANGRPVSPPGMPPVRTAAPEDAARVRAVAAQAFRAYAGHYHADRRLDRAAADEVYPDWAFRCCVDRSFADEVFVCGSGEGVAGFLTARARDPQAEILLCGVLPREQRRGVHGALTAAALAWARDRGRARVVVSTQLLNTAAQAAWLKAGFRPHGSQYTFHLWTT